MSAAEAKKLDSSTDFASFDELYKNMESGTEMTVRHPVTGAPTGMKMTVASYDSEATTRVNRAIIERRRASGRTTPMSPEEVDEENLDVTISTILGWSGCRLDGEDLEFSTENLRRFLRRFRFVREQADAHAGSRASFLKV